MSNVSEPELIFALDQLGARLSEQCMAERVDTDAVVWAARQQMRMLVEMLPDVPDLDNVVWNGACGMAAWWAMVVGTGLGAPDLVAEARRWWIV